MKMNEDLIPVLAEMRLYYTACAENAMPGSKAERKFTGYYAALDQAIARLSQELVKPRWTHPTVYKNVLICGNCGIEIPLGKPNYCPWCGRKVNWDD